MAKKRAAPVWRKSPDDLIALFYAALSEDPRVERRKMFGYPCAFVGGHFNRHKHLKLNDCFALSLAEDIDESILLTGDGPLRAIAEGKETEVHGVLWLTDEFGNSPGCGSAPTARRAAALAPG